MQTTAVSARFKQFGRYEIIRKLGRGMTDAYLAFDPEADRRVVLKIVEPSPDPFTKLVIDAERRGAAIQKQLHEAAPDILAVYEYGEQSGCFFVAMEYVPGENLAEVLRRKRKLEPKRAARYALEVCRQLERLHSFEVEIDSRKRAVVHGDIKPSNIQIAPDDRIRLLDFGIAKAITLTHNLTHHNLGSPSYCSPERLATSQVDTFADLWAVAVTLYEMVSGMPPYQAQDTRRLERIIQSKRPPRALPESCPPALKAIIEKALAPELSARYACAHDFASDLERFLRDEATAAGREARSLWQVAETIDKAPPRRLLTPTRKRQLATALQETNRIVWGLAAGLICGLAVFIPLGYLYHLRQQAAPLRSAKDYFARSAGDIDADWAVYRRLQSQADWKRAFLPLDSVRGALKASYTRTASEVIDSYRNSSDATLQHYDWPKAKLCLDRALEIDPGDRVANANRALVTGYLNVEQRDFETARSLFQKAAALLPESPSPRLALARVEVYGFQNVGAARAHLHEAEALGFKRGPRENQFEADGYLARAELRLTQARQATSAAQAAADVALARADFERARALYEPLAGFANVSDNLHQLYIDESGAAQLVTAKHAVRAPRHTRKRATHHAARHRRWR